MKPGDWEVVEHDSMYVDGVHVAEVPNGITRIVIHFCTSGVRVSEMAEMSRTWDDTTCTYSSPSLVLRGPNTLRTHATYWLEDKSTTEILLIPLEMIQNRTVTRLL